MVRRGPDRSREFGAVAADPKRPHEGAEPRALCLGIGGGAGALLSARLRVSRALRLSRVGVCVATSGDVLGVEDGGGEFSSLFIYDNII